MFKFDNGIGLQRVGKLRIRDRRISTPSMFLGQSIKSPVSPWTDGVPADGVLLNAYEILSSNKFRNIAEERGIKEIAKHKNVILDSGGFLYLKKSAKQKSKDAFDIFNGKQGELRKKIFKIQEKSNAIINVPLDCPPVYSDPYEERKMELTLKNTRFWFRYGNGIEKMPVIHASLSENNFKTVMKKFKRYKTDYIGLGGLVPVLMGRTTENDRISTIDKLVDLRLKFWSKFLHVFGVGGTNTIRLMFLLGVDSVDSIGWRIRAAHRILLVDGIGERHVIKKERGWSIKFISNKEWRLLRDCECPVCSSHNLSRLKKLYISSFEHRCIHNAWIQQKEVEIARDLISSGEYEEYIKNRLNTGIWRKITNYAFKKLKEESKCKNF